MLLVFRTNAYLAFVKLLSCCVGLSPLHKHADARLVCLRATTITCAIANQFVFQPLSQALTTPHSQVASTPHTGPRDSHGRRNPVQPGPVEAFGNGKDEGDQRHLNGGERCVMLFWYNQSNQPEQSQCPTTAFLHPPRYFYCLQWYHTKLSIPPIQPSTVKFACYASQTRVCPFA
jgi:hypothetical protein